MGQMAGRREWIEIVDWTTILGTLSGLPAAYFWGCGLAMQMFRVRCPGDTFVVLIAILGSIPLSAVVGSYGSRYWWIVTAAATGTFIFFVLRLR